MSDPFLGEMQIFAFPYAPRNWSIANGAQLPTNQYTALFSLFGTSFGGNGQTTFAIPNAQTRFVCGTGQGRGLSQRALGATTGSASVALTANQNPSHTHQVSDFQPTAVNQRTPVPGDTRGLGYGDGLLAFAAPTGGTLAAATLLPSGQGAPHENRQPFLALNYCVSLAGIFPNTASSA